MFRKLVRSKERKELSHCLKDVLKKEFPKHTRKIVLRETWSTVSMSTQETFHTFYLHDKTSNEKKDLGVFEFINRDVLHQGILQVIGLIEKTRPYYLRDDGSMIILYSPVETSKFMRRMIPYVNGKRKPLFNVRSSEGPHIYAPLEIKK